MSDAYYAFKKRIREFKPEIRKCEECSGEFLANVPHQRMCKDSECIAIRQAQRQVLVNYELQELVYASVMDFNPTEQ